MTIEEAQEMIVGLIKEQLTEYQWNDLCEFIKNGGKVECNIEEKDDHSLLHLNW